MTTITKLNSMTPKEVLDYAIAMTTVMESMSQLRQSEADQRTMLIESLDVCNQRGNLYRTKIAEIRERLCPSCIEKVTPEWAFDVCFTEIAPSSSLNPFNPE